MCTRNIHDPLSQKGIFYYSKCPLDVPDTFLSYLCCQDSGYVFLRLTVCDPDFWNLTFFNVDVWALLLTLVTLTNLSETYTSWDIYLSIWYTPRCGHEMISGYFSKVLLDPIIIFFVWLLLLLFNLYHQ